MTMNTIIIVLIMLSVLVTLSTVIMVSVSIHAETYMKYKRQLMEEDRKKASLERTDFMELKDTIELMQSTDYKDRFKAEYYQIKIMREKLIDLLYRRHMGKSGFNSDCPYDLLDKQLRTITAYKDILEERAVIEKIEL